MQMLSAEDKSYFSGVRWFERKEVRDEQNLTQEDLKYVRGWSISSLGYGNIIYIVTRRMPDILIVSLITGIYFEVSERLFGEEPENVAIVFLNLGMIIVALYIFIFTLRHGRRLSWNRGRYIYSWNNFVHPTLKQFDSVDELRKSERRFNKYSAIPSLIISACAFAIAAFLLIAG